MTYQSNIVPVYHNAHLFQVQINPFTDKRHVMYEQNNAFKIAIG